MNFDLTEKEQEIYELLAKTDYTLEEAAKQLYITRTTIVTHLQNIYQKLNINSRGALIRHYYSGGEQQIKLSFKEQKEELKKYIKSFEKLREKLNEWHKIA